MLLDGEHLLADALDAGVPIEVVLTSPEHHALGQRSRSAGAEVFDASPAVIDAASPVRTPSGIVALARWRPATLGDVVRGPHALVLGLCGVQDPGNVGSAIRSADALGATGVLALDETANPSGWKALRGAMGSTFRTSVAVAGMNDALTEARAAGLQIVATTADRGEPIDAVDLRKPALVLLGSEGAGLSEDVVRHASVRATIPMRPGINSLNVAATAALVLYEARRQRMMKPPVTP